MGDLSGLYECPSCKFPLRFRHNDTRLKACERCGSVVFRKEREKLSVRSCYLVKSDGSIGIGTLGQWRGQSFEVIGRLRIWFHSYVVNYWTVLLSNGALAYLAESYGLYAILTPRQQDKTLRAEDIKKAQKKPVRILGNHLFTLQHKSTAVRMDAEGEIGLCPHGESTVIYSFASSDIGNIEIWLSGRDLVVFDAEYLSFSQLNLSGLQSSQPALKEFTCPECAGAVCIKNYPYAQSCTCSCGAHLIITAAGMPEVVGKNETADGGAVLQPGAKGRVKGIEYEVVGFGLKQDHSEHQSRWKEYVLYNVHEGYAFLNEYEGHWIYSRETENGPVVNERNAKQINYKGKVFELFNEYRFSLVFASGEFPGNYFNTARLQTVEYIAPPEMWVLEFEGDETVTARGWHVSKGELEKAFDTVLPWQTGVGAIQPKGTAEIKKMLTVWAIAAMVLIITHVGIGLFQDKRLILSQEYPVTDTLPVSTIITPRFQLKKWKSNLAFEISAPVNNSWLELDMQLVNARTGNEYNLVQGVEYYAGYSDGESWSEGSTSEECYLSSLPAGDYFLRIRVTRENQWALQYFSLTVRNDVPVHRNLLLLLLILSIWPAAMYYRSWVSERKRWYNSPFSPYTYYENDKECI